MLIKNFMILINSDKKLFKINFNEFLKLYDEFMKNIVLKFYQLFTSFIQIFYSFPS